MQTNIPKYLTNIFTTNKNNTRLGMNTVTLNVKAIKLSRDQHLLAHSASKLWNELPPEIRNSDNKTIFATKIKNYYLNKKTSL